MTSPPAHRARVALLLITLSAATAQACSESTAAPFAPRPKPDPSGDDQDAGEDGGDIDVVRGTTTEEQIDMLAQVGADILDPAKVCSGWDHSCAIDFEGKAWCWGSGTAEIDPPDDLPPLVKIACGDQHTCAIGEDQQIYCWGEGTVDDPSMFTMASVGQSVVPPGNYLELAIGPNSLTTCAINTRNQIVCWGAGDRNAPASSRAAVGQGLPPIGRYWGIAEGDAHACAIDIVTGEAVCWGGGSIGCIPPESWQCGQLAAPPGPFVQLAAGSYHTCGLRETGEVVCWGMGQHNDNCDPDSNEVKFDCNQSVVPDDVDGAFITLYAGTIHACAVTEFYQGICWGWGGYRQIVVPDTDFAQLAPGDKHTCGLRTDGQVVCWGFSTAVNGLPPDFPGVY